MGLNGLHSGCLRALARRPANSQNKPTPNHIPQPINRRTSTVWIEANRGLRITFIKGMRPIMKGRGANQRGGI